MKRPCVNFRNGYCPYTGGQCRDNMPGPCPLWRSLAKATAARIRWARPARRGHDRKEEGNRQTQERIQTMNIPFTLTVHEDIGDMPDWMFYALCALPYVLLIIGIIG